MKSFEITALDRISKSITIVEERVSKPEQALASVAAKFPQLQILKIREITDGPGNCTRSSYDYQRC